MRRADLVPLLLAGGVFALVLSRRQRALPVVIPPVGPGATPTGTTPAGTTPAGTTPSGTPAGTTPAGTPAGTTPAGTTPAGTTPAGTPAGTTPAGTAPGTPAIDQSSITRPVPWADPTAVAALLTELDALVEKTRNTADAAIGLAAAQRALEIRRQQARRVDLLALSEDLVRYEGTPALQIPGSVIASMNAVAEGLRPYGDAVATARAAHLEQIAARVREEAGNDTYGLVASAENLDAGAVTPESIALMRAAVDLLRAYSDRGAIERAAHIESVLSRVFGEIDRRSYALLTRYQATLTGAPGDALRDMRSMARQFRAYGEGAAAERAAHLEHVVTRIETDGAFARCAGPCAFHNQSERYGEREAYPAAFVLPAGSMVRRVERDPQDGWLHVQAPDGQTGWIRASQIGLTGAASPGPSPFLGQPAAATGAITQLRRRPIDPFTGQPVITARSAKPPLSRGAAGGNVPLLQRLLQSSGRPWVSVDGDFGMQTEREVMAFQRERGLPPTGIVDAPTWRALELAAGTTTGGAETGVIDLRRYRPPPPPPPGPINVLRGGRRVVCNQDGGCIVLPFYALWARNRNATRASFQHDYRAIPKGAVVQVIGEFDAPPGSWARAYYFRSGRTEEVPGIPAASNRVYRIRYRGPSVHPITGQQYDDLIADGFVDVLRLEDTTGQLEREREARLQVSGVSGVSA